MQCLILAGGLGTRMKPYTEKIPKALIPVRGHPFIDLQLRALKRQGIKRVVICVGYLGEMIQAEVGDGSRFDLHVDYTNEGENLRGTAGAIRLAADQGVLDEEFFVLYGDSFLPTSFPTVFEKFKSGSDPALMTVFRNEGQFDKSNAQFNGERVTLYDKKLSAGTGVPYIDYGLSILSRKLVLERIPADGVRDLADLFHQLSVEGRLAGLEVKERFYEIGSQQGLADLESYLGTH